MARAAFIEIDGKRYLWRDILELRKQQLPWTQPWSAAHIEICIRSGGRNALPRDERA
jgi:antirestriction protein ArdC